MKAQRSESDLRVTSISAGSSHTAVVLQGPGGSLVATCGRGEDGQLGHGRAGDQLSPAAVEALSGREPSAVVCGAEFTFAICKGGEEVYSWGWGDFGRLGHGDCSDVFIPRLVSSLQGLLVKRVACGDQHTLVLLDDGQLLSFGRNQNGQLGNGSTQDGPSARPVANFSSETVVDIACGAEHSLCLTSAGRAYAWGWGSYGNLGTGTAEDEIVPVPLKGLDNLQITALASGWRHSFVVDSNGYLYSFGWNKYGQLGNGKFENSALPQRIEALREHKVKIVHGGWRHTVVATSGGVFAWGWNKFGQLGVGHSDKNPSVPVQLEVFADASDPVEMLVAGWKHTVFVTASGTVFATGRGNAGQLGMPVTEDLYTPKRIDGLSAGSIKLEDLERETTGSERMFVPASDRYAVVPGTDGPECVPNSAPVLVSAEPKRARLV